MNINKIFENLEDIKLDNKITEMISRINKCINKFEEGKIKYNSNYIDTWNNQVENLKKSLSMITVNVNMDNMVKAIKESDLVDILTKSIESFENLENIEILKYTDRNIVVVGANGSGKTTFLKHLMENNNNIGISYYPSERLFLSKSAEKFSQNTDIFNKDFENNRRNMLDSKNIYRASNFANDFEFTIALLVNRHNQEMQEGTDKSNTVAQRILNKWRELIKTRSLIIERNQIVGVFNDEKYGIENLSSGEKSILYFLSNILLLERSNYYIIDEPENSLNASIVSQLWSYIEEEKKDSTFVYLTHDSNFVISRNNSDKYWMKGYLGKTKWDFQELPVNDNLPEELMVQLVGTKQPIIFVESENSSKFDHKLYTLMFPEFKIIAVGGCDQVKFKTKAYKSLNLNPAYGIIDCDYHKNEYLEGQKKHNIYHAPFFEIENLLVSEDIIEAVLEYHKVGLIKERISEFKKQILDDLLRNLKEKSIIKISKMTRNEIFTVIRETSFDVNYELNNLKNGIQELSNTDVDLVYNENKKIIDEIIKNPTHNGILRYLDDKNNLMNRVGRFSGMEHYEDNILRFLQATQNQLLIEMRKQYFPEIL